MRKHSSADDIIVPVYRVHPIDKRNVQSRTRRARLKFVVDVGPGNQIVAGLRIGIAAAQNRPEAIGGHILRFRDVHPVRLSHLPDFFFERHLPQDGQSLFVIARKDAAARRRSRATGQKRGTCQRRAAGVEKGSSGCLHEPKRICIVIVLQSAAKKTSFNP